MTVVDLFAGMGGWDIAARQLGVDPLGVEWNADACATREAVGLRTLHADISELDPADFAPCEGLIASPPCQDFSVAGKGAGRGGERGRLVDVVPVWVDVLRPRWVACEQVPPVLPIWREFGLRFEQWGYRCWAGLLSAERHGVPQTRERAFLLASLDGPVAPPAPTHQEYRHGVPARREVGLFGALEPWVSMAEALGWNDGMALRQWRGKGMVERYGSRPDREASEPSFAVTGAGTKLVVDRRTNSRGENAIRLTEAEGLTLQGFPPDWPVQGTKTTRWTQIGNAVPPPLARAVLAQVIPTQEAAA